MLLLEWLRFVFLFPVIAVIQRDAMFFMTDLQDTWTASHISEFMCSAPLSSAEAKKRNHGRKRKAPHQVQQGDEEDEDEDEDEGEDEDEAEDDEGEEVGFDDAAGDQDDNGLDD